ncbi:glyoxalase/bleomycin resistance protein/dihydroxybiphenyl dioxygenase [Chloropicon primus]|uniref:Glyoxalase/bleomycin resistance protein/dihydroxybiphenyl dioxygenase n=1 Tax=Chloropicon primus TaxID=1764295 RepID=A0A5B8MBG9_9CHLO|nr:glyoxalase/bleomycin resistance protein/dihydroxybiphenyl dioxygenase [Chloropicon primus]UPQ96983.1 glyoxalase/bleomycin resistance protein/dihydroxybiphenyl dioxygenase [Chloropicon primus]|eukprot:QDZ17766.1 glyoxalase/bleomycin resistance protein/dihydroxybiphenyl dioxygenase [Chloropicon primus]
MAGARLANVLLLQRDVQHAIKFYSKGLGLHLASESPKYAELTCSAGNTIALKQVEGEALRSTGYSPMLSFNVEDLQGTLTRLLSLGAHMDGPIRYPTFGKVAAVRAPDGHMISLFESDDGL